jgi:hypothetical protein
MISILEQTAWRRFHVLSHAFDRLSVPHKAVEYQRLHAVLDEEHGRELRDVLCQHFVKANPNTARQLCLGIVERSELLTSFFYPVLCADRRPLHVAVYVASDYYDEIRREFKLEN